jgi:S1-C subfamily serine protease
MMKTLQTILTFLQNKSILLLESSGSGFSRGGVTHRIGVYVDKAHEKADYKGLQKRLGKVSKFLCSFSLALGLAFSVDAGLTTERELERQRAAFTDRNQALIALVREVVKAVVLVHWFFDVRDDRSIHPLFPMGEKSKQFHKVCSGVCVTANGHIVTSCPLGEAKIKRIVVSVNSESRPRVDGSGMVLTEDDYEAEVVRHFPDLGISVLKIEKKVQSLDFPYVPLGDDSRLREKGTLLHRSAFAIGKSVGEQFITYNVRANRKNNFSLLAYPIEYVSYELVDGVGYIALRNNVFGSCVFPENAGGGVIDEKGQLIGIVDFSKTKEEMFFLELAVPVSVVKQAMRIAAPSLFAEEFDSDLGMTFKEIKDYPIQAAKKTLSKLYGEKKVGVLIETVEKDSMADSGELHPGDIILECNGQPVENTICMENMAKRQIGERTIEFRILRGKNIIDIVLRR